MKQVVALAALAALTIGGSTSASAISMPLTTAPVGNGTDTVSKCDTDGFSAGGFTTVAGKVTGITVAGISVGCQGGTLYVNLTQGGSSVAAGGPVTVTTTSHLVNVTGNPNALNVDGMHAVVIGP